MPLLKKQHRVRISLIWESQMSHSYGPLVLPDQTKLFAFAALRPLAARFIIGHNEIDMAYTERAGELK
jgi:hypothetical protein